MVNQTRREVCQVVFNLPANFSILLLLQVGEAAEQLTPPLIYDNSFWSCGQKLEVQKKKEEGRNN